MQVFARVPVRGPGGLVDDVGRDGADLDEAVVLDEDGVARQVAVDDGRLRPLKMTMTQPGSITISHMPVYGQSCWTNRYLRTG